MKLGWRKLSAWFLVFALGATASLVFRYEIPANNIELIEWTTAFFFGANAVEHLSRNFTVSIGAKA